MRDPLSRGDRRRGTVAEPEVVSLDKRLLDGEGSVRYDLIPDPSDFASDVAVAELYERLPPRERLITRLTSAGYLLQEAGEMLGVTESRACQMRKRAYQRLAADGFELEAA